MKFSKETLSTMKNFSAINPNLMLKKGLILNTISSGKSLVGSAVITDEIPQDFGIYDVSEFLGALSLFEDPEITFHEKFVVISQGPSSMKFFSADESCLVYPKKFPTLADPDIEFSLTAANITAILKTAGVLKTNDVRIIGENGKLSVVVGEKKNQTANNFVLQLGETDKEFVISLSTENLKIVPQDFKAEVINQRMVRLVSETLTYIIAIESDSDFK